jgi:hypothetical protein
MTMAEDERTHMAAGCTWIKYLVDGEWVEL